MRQIIKSPEPAYFVKWKSDFKAAEGRDATYEDLHGKPEYGKLKKSLLKEQGYICCYCEKRIGINWEDCDIEHFMPRHPDKRYLSAAECKVCEDAQLTYTNLLVSCKGEVADSIDHCNHKKDNWFDFRACISPCDIGIKEAFGYRLDGRMFAVKASVQEMEKHLNLNSYIVTEQRKSALEAVLEVEFEDEVLLCDEEYMEAVIEDYDSLQGGSYAEFCSMITYCLREYYS